MGKKKAGVHPYPISMTIHNDVVNVINNYKEKKINKKKSIFQK